MTNRVEQVLYGYRDGHRRLAGSAPPLESQGEQAMLTLSDLAAPGNRSFHAYLTGFPLAGGHRYVLARTWPADEIHRPGAVWTHALLIPVTHLAHLEDPAQMLRAFRRPTPNDQRHLDFYRHPPSFDSSAKPTDGRVDHNELKAALAALYRTPNAPVVAPGSPDSSTDHLVMALWRQQWPRLRRTFSFCTWVTVARKVYGRNLDLYIAPPGAGRSLMRDLDGAVAADHAETQPPAWVDSLATDALSSRPTELRYFLWRYAADINSTREAMLPLLNVRTTLMENDRPTVAELSNLAGFVCSSFPSPSDAVALKRALFGPPDDREHAADDDAVLIALAERYPSCLEAQALDVRLRSSRLWSSPANHVQRLLEASGGGDMAPSTLRGAIVYGLASTARATELQLLDSKPALVAPMANARIELLSIPDAWRKSGGEQERLLDAIDASHDHELEPHVVEGTWTRARDQLVDALVARTGLERILAAVMETGEKRGWTNVASSWTRLLSEHSDVTMSLLSDERSVSPRTASALARHLNPLDPAVRSLDCSFWIPLTDQPQADSRTAVATATFAFAVGLRCSGDASERLLAWAFPTVHAAAIRQRLPATRWDWIDPWLPSGKPWKRWDRAERLRRFIAHAIVEERWRSDSIIMALPDPELFIEVIGRVRGIPGSEDVLRNLANHLHRTSGYADHEHLMRDVLDTD